MSGYHAKLDDKRFTNWIKTCIAIDIFRAYVETFVYKEIEKFHSSILETIANENKTKSNIYCSECKTANVLDCKTNNFCTYKHGKCTNHFPPEHTSRSCPKNICNRIKYFILKCHDFNSPTWQNTSAEKWCYSAWELAKCYMPKGGYFEKQSPAETDLNGIISVMLNNSNISGTIDKSNCEEIRGYCNSLRHTSNFYVVDQKLAMFLDMLVSFLENSPAFHNDKKAKEAIKEIKEVRAEEFKVTVNDVTKVIQKSIQEERIQCSKDMAKESKDYIEELQKLRSEIETIATKSINEVNSAEHKAIEKITSTVSIQVSAGKDEIEKATKDARTEIESFVKGTNTKLRERLRKDLLDWNKSKHNEIPITPLFDDTEVPITDFYVCPQLVSVERQSYGSFGKEMRIPTNSLRDVFYKHELRHNEIYLTSDAGFGKSSFSKYLVMAWWYALTPDSDPSSQYFSEEDKKVMEVFDYVFLINLRELAYECDVDKIIFSHIICDLSHSSEYSLSFLQNILHDENCLIILDGLDEWSHPTGTECNKCDDIPHRKARQACTVLTTSRPWKLSAIKVRTSQIDKHVELCALTKDQIICLKKMSVTKLIGRNGEISNIIEVLNAEIKERELESLESNPMLLMYLVCLKTEGKPLGKSKSELYTQIIELLLVRAIQKTERNSSNDMNIENLTKGDLDQENIPLCLREHELPLQYYHLLKQLGHLAFTTLFDDRKSNTLVFDKKKASGCLSKDCLHASLFSGMLTESKIMGSLLIKQSNVSFCHKTIQEYFAAIYMHMTRDEDFTVKTTLNFCNSVDRLLEMEKVFIFLCGCSYETFERFSNELWSVVETDKSATEYRHGCISSTSNYNMKIKPMKDLQSMYISCLKEIEMQNDGSKIQNIGKLKLYLHDIFIDEDCKDNKYMLYLKSIKEMNEGKMKSFSIRIEGFSNFGDIEEKFQLEKETSLEKINFRGECCSNDIQKLLCSSANSLKCVEILSSIWTDNRFVPTYTIWTDAITNTFQRMHNLEALHLYAFQMSHTQLKEMISFIEQHTIMKDIAILNLKCADHDLCSGCQLDLSGHRKLRLLSIDNVPLSKLSINVSELEDCVVGKISNSSVLSSFLTALKSAIRVQGLTCRHISSTDEIDKMIETISSMPNLSFIRLLYSDLGEKQVFLSNKMSSLQLVRFVEVIMQCCVLCDIVMVIKSFPKPVTIELSKCTVYTETEFDAFKTEIKKDSKILFVHEGSGCELTFKTYGNQKL